MELFGVKTALFFDGAKRGLEMLRVSDSESIFILAKSIAV